MKVDITVNELVVFPLIERVVLQGYEEFSDLPENRSIFVYSLDEIATEKTLALADPARNEPRDLYDLWHLTTNEGIEIDPLIPAIRQKLEFRHKACEGLQAAITRKEARLAALWEARLSHEMTALLPFERVFRAVRRTLRQTHSP